MANQNTGLQGTTDSINGLTVANTQAKPAIDATANSLNGLANQNAQALAKIEETTAATQKETSEVEKNRIALENQANNLMKVNAEKQKAIEAENLLIAAAEHYIQSVISVTEATGRNNDALIKVVDLYGDLTQKIEAQNLADKNKILLIEQSKSVIEQEIIQLQNKQALILGLTADQLVEKQAITNSIEAKKQDIATLTVESQLLQSKTDLIDQIIDATNKKINVGLQDNNQQIAGLELTKKSHENTLALINVEKQIALAKGDTTTATRLSADATNEKNNIEESSLDIMRQQIAAYQEKRNGLASLLAQTIALANAEGGIDNAEQERINTIKSEIQEVDNLTDSLSEELSSKEALQDANQRLQSAQKDTTETTKKAAVETKNLGSISSWLGDTFNSNASEVADYNAQVVALFNSLTGANVTFKQSENSVEGLGQRISSLREHLSATNEALKSNFDPFNRWALNIEAASDTAQLAFLEQKRKFLELMAALQDGSVTMGELNHATSMLSYGFTMLDESDLSQLRSQIESVTEAMKNAQQTAASLAESIHEDFLQATGDTEALDAFRARNKLEDQLADIAEAKSAVSFDDASVRALTRAEQEAKSVYSLEMEGLKPTDYNFLDRPSVSTPVTLSSQQTASYHEPGMPYPVELTRQFASGGYTGDGSDNEIAGVVHKNEYVLNSTALEALNRGQEPRTQSIDINALTTAFKSAMSTLTIKVDISQSAITSAVIAELNNAKRGIL